MKYLVSILLTGVLVTACGRGGSSKSSSAGPQATTQQNESVAVDGSNITGYYKAVFTTLNGFVNGTVPGSFTFYRNDERLFIFGRLFAGYPQAWHRQAVYTGDRCPTLADDVNKDGHLDLPEAERVLGKILIPLDSDPSTQASGSRFYPLADLSGSYHYERVVSFRRMFEDLKSPDRDTSDNVVKLAEDQGLNLIGRPVLITGVTEAANLPDTVASGTNRYRNFQTYPVVCGLFKKDDITPGTRDTGEIPGPVGDYEPGQDRPAPDDNTSTGTGNSTGSGDNRPDDGDTTDENGNRGGSTSTPTGPTTSPDNTPDDTPQPEET